MVCVMQKQTKLFKQTWVISAANIQSTESNNLNLMLTNSLFVYLMVTDDVVDSVIIKPLFRG